MKKELKELIELGQKYPELNKEELVRYVHLQGVIDDKLERLENYEQNEDFSKDVLNYAFLNEQDEIKKLKTKRKYIIGNSEQCEVIPLRDEETQNKLKAFEIVKKKKVWVDALNETLWSYNRYCRKVWGTPELTQAEYDFLREVLL